MTITLATSWIADISMDTYTVSTVDGSGNVLVEGTISPTRFAVFLSIIESRLLKDGLLDSTGNIITGNEYLAALLVCDLIQSGPITDLGIKSEDFGGAYSYTRSEAAAASTKSAFMMKYEEALTTRYRGKQASTGQARCDYQIEFAKLSQGTIPAIADSSADYPTM